MRSIRQLLICASVFILSSCFVSHTDAQVVFEPTYKTVYGYLSRLAQKGVIDLNDVVLPLSRAYIATKLDTLSYHTRKLTPLEQEELIFYRKDYTLENNLLQQVDLETPYKSVLKTRLGDRFRVASYQDKQFSVNAQPILGYENEFVLENGSNISRSWKGAWLYGYIGKHIGFSFDFFDNQESGKNYDSTRPFDPKTGVILSNAINQDVQNNSQLRATISASWKWGALTIGKDFIPIGYGAGGKIIISERPPAFPMIRLDIKPVDWLSFNYAHIWLNTNLIDSSSLRPSSISGIYSFNFRDKYLVTHSLTIMPTKKVNICVGENSIYSDKIQPIYFMPILFFNGLDHYLGSLSNNSISNTQIFFQVSSRNQLSNTHFFFTFLIDEMRIQDIFASKNVKNHTGYTIGASVADFPINNISLKLEYTRIRPFVYENYQPTQTYTTTDNYSGVEYSIGHWIGSNADQLFFNMLWRIKRGLHLNVTYSYVNKGDKGTPQQQQHALDVPFLFGQVKTYEDFTMNLKYELIHDLVFKIAYSSRHHREISKISNNTFNSGLSFGFNYGF